MIQVATIADSHFDETSRWEECIRVHDWIAQDCERRAVDLIIHTGDVFERKSTPKERSAVAAWLTRLAAIAPVVVVRGNHDALGDLTIFRRLRTVHPILVDERANSWTIQTKGGHVHVAVLAWPQKAHVHAALEAITGAPVSLEQSEQGAGLMLQNVLRGLGDALSARRQVQEGPTIFASHAMVRGSMTSTGQPLVGCDLEIGLEDLALVRADLIALGHIHLGQEWDVAGAPAIYPGSPRRTAFGETEAKGYLLATFACEDDVGGGSWGLVDWERLETPATRMFLVEEEWGADGLSDQTHPTWICGLHGEPNRAEYSGSEVRFRYHVKSDQRDAARAALSGIRAYFTGHGVSVLKIEEVVVATARARAPEVAQGRTLEEQLAALWATKRPDLAPERSSTLIARLGDLR